MTKIVIGEFDSEVEAKAAINKLVAADVSMAKIDTYPSLTTPEKKDPKLSEKVQGAETPMSKDGPLGHFGAIVAKLFHAEDHSEAVSGGSEPTRERTNKTPIFLSVRVDATEGEIEKLELILEGAGASRVAHHDE
ncbi:hypothetical protein [Robbsia sp. KACC 23696]|uniref:hypothetical protein n=1 Tax=Robbsia sp. KACC 23696 TaxID=3149231 RepID=UPI00325B7769